MSHLTDNDRQALELARDLRANMQQWLTQHGANGTFSISPFVDPSGKPSVIITMDSPLALAMMRSLNQQSAPAPQHPGQLPVPTQAYR
jgi:hypothetical protein